MILYNMLLIPPVYLLDKFILCLCYRIIRGAEIVYVGDIISITIGSNSMVANK